MLLAQPQHDTILSAWPVVPAVLATAARHVESEGVQGSCTACILTVNKDTGRLQAATLGDSGFFIVGPRAPMHGDLEVSRGGDRGKRRLLAAVSVPVPVLTGCGLLQWAAACFVPMPVGQVAALLEDILYKHALSVRLNEGCSDSLQG